MRCVTCGKSLQRPEPLCIHLQGGVVTNALAGEFIHVCAVLRKEIIVYQQKGAAVFTRLLAVLQLMAPLGGSLGFGKRALLQVAES